MKINNLNQELGKEGNLYSEYWQYSEDGGETWNYFSEDLQIEMQSRKDLWIA